MISPNKRDLIHDDPFNRPIYYSAEVSRFVKISPSRVHRWLEGYHYQYQSQYVKQPPVIGKRKQETSPTSYASFNDLIDLLFIKQFLDHGISLQKLRIALEEAKNILGTNHFVHQKFYTDGRNICLEIDNGAKAMLELLSGGQWVIGPLIEQLAKQIDFDQVTKLARRWYPPEGNNLVVLDPLYSFGKPIIKNKGIKTEIIYDFFMAEGKNETLTCNWYNIAPEELRAAVNFQSHLPV